MTAIIIPFPTRPDARRSMLRLVAGKDLHGLKISGTAATLNNRIAAVAARKLGVVPTIRDLR